MADVKDLLEKIDTKRLKILADWIDLKFPDPNKTEVQEDLRRWANCIDQALTKCKWTWDEDNEKWTTSCQKVFISDENASPSDLLFCTCPFCGHEIEEVK